MKIDLSGKRPDESIIFTNGKVDSTESFKGHFVKNIKAGILANNVSASKPVETKFGFYPDGHVVHVPKYISTAMC